MRIVDTPERPDETEESFGASDEQAERKLWLDYFKSINDRALQASQRSGVTSYVLLATIAGLLYKFGPKAPAFLAIPGAPQTFRNLFVLITLVASSFLFIAVLGILLCTGDPEFRAVSKRDASLKRLAQVMAGGTLAIWIYLDLRTAFSDVGRLTRWTLVCHALWLAVNMAVPVIQYRNHLKRAKDIKFALPRFSLTRMSPNGYRGGLVVASIWLVLGVMCTRHFLFLLPGFGMPFLKAVCVTLTAWILLCLVFLRVMHSVSRDAYLGLERAIVLDRLSASQIRGKYLSELSGPDMAQWLDGMFESLRIKEAKLVTENDRAKLQLNEITKIDAEYRVERRERARVCVDSLRAAINDCMNLYKAVNFQTGVFVAAYRTPEEVIALDERLERTSTSLSEFERITKDAVTTLAKLEEVAS